MDFDFTQTLTLLLIGLLFAKDTLLPAILKKMGLTNGNGNSHVHQAQINALNDHAKIANEEMGDIRRDISEIKQDISFIKGKLDS